MSLCKVVGNPSGSRPLSAVLYLVRVIAVIATMRVLQYVTDHTNSGDGSLQRRDSSISRKSPDALPNGRRRPPLNCGFQIVPE